MSTGRSPSGVASLRAKFEQKDESTSPPSRGRSPATSLSVAGDSSRPISKVRTSFVSVEPSGQMGDLNAAKEVGSEGHIPNSDGAGEYRTNGTSQKPKTNGTELTPKKSMEIEENTPEHMTTKDSPGKEDGAPSNKPGKVNGASPDAKPDNLTSADEEKSIDVVPPDSKEVIGVSGGAAREGEASPLGSILKGSPFEQEEKKGEASDGPEAEVAAEPGQCLEATSPNTPMTSEKPKEVSAQKIGLQSNHKRTPRPPSINGKKSATQPASSTRRSENKPHTSTLSSPKTPKNTATPSKQPISKRLSPNSMASKEPKKEPLRDVKKTTTERTSRKSVQPKATAPASKPATNPVKKSGPTSPPSFTKPRPKSPTRPVRLPGSATAPTAASAAKRDAAPAATARPKDRVISNPTSQRQKPARTSLPASSKPAERAKDKPKSRLSTVSSKAPDGSFLDRMTRPTQSSSQKTHEKVEIKTPPKKTNEVRTSRKSDGSEKAKSEDLRAKSDRPKTRSGEPTETAPSSSVQVPDDSSESPGPQEAEKGIEEAASASEIPIPLQ